MFPLCWYQLVSYVKNDDMGIFRTINRHQMFYYFQILPPVDIGDTQTAKIQIRTKEIFDMVIRIFRSKYGVFEIPHICKMLIIASR